MLSYHDAVARMLQDVQGLPSERLGLLASSGRIVAATLASPNDAPPFAQSMVDGYAVRSRDTHAATQAHPVRLTLGPTLMAGASLGQPLTPHQALRIMTGAPLPPGANTVIKLEESTIEDGALILRQPLPSGLGMQRRGADIRRQTVILHPGQRLTPQGIGLALSLGIDTVEVIRQPRVALIAPGDELLPPGAPWQPGKKWCSNLYALDLRTQEVGGSSVNLGIVPDTLDSLSTQLQRGLEADVVVILGASGRGDHDFAARAMATIGAATVFRGVAANPGRSVTVARCGSTLIVGLPGSPWAAFVGFEVFVWPILRALLHQKPAVPHTHAATLMQPLRFRPGMTSFVPTCVQSTATGMQAWPVTTLLAVARTSSARLGLLVAPPHRRQLPAGAKVRIQPITAW